MVFSKKDHLVGLDIGSSSIKVAELQISRKKKILKKFGMKPLIPGAIVDGRIMGAVSQKTDQRKNDEKKEKQSNDFFAHSYTSRMNGRITGRRFMVNEKYFLSAL